MELQQFVSESLNQIIQGVTDAKRANTHSGIEVNPRLTNSALGEDARIKLPEDVILSAEGKTVVIVNFDVAVTVTEGTGTKGGIGVFTGLVGLGSQGQTDKSNISITKMQFKVPVALPTA